MSSGNDPLVPDARLIIPIAPGRATDASTYARAATRYKVRKGDTVQSVAQNFGVSEKMVRGWNHLKGNSFAGRRVLYIHLPLTPGAREIQAENRKPAARKSASRSSTSKSSNLAPRRAATKTAETRAAAHSSGAHSAADHPALTRHRVKQGETLSSIASSYNTTVSALKHDNRNIAALRPGMILVIRDVR